MTFLNEKACMNAANVCELELSLFASQRDSLILLPSAKLEICRIVEKICSLYSGKCMIVSENTAYWTEFAHFCTIFACAAALNFVKENSVSCVIFDNLQEAIVNGNCGMIDLLRKSEAKSRIIGSFIVI